MAPLSDGVLDKYFQFFTHLSTLNSAGAVIVLAISQTRPEGMELALVPLAAFGLSLLASLSGMEVVMVCLSREDRAETRITVLWRWGVGAAKYLNEAHRFTVVFFVGGLFAFAYRDIVKSCGSASPVTRLPSPQFPQPTLRF